MYQAQGSPVADAAVQALCTTAVRLDLAPGPGGSRLVWYGPADAPYHRIVPWVPDPVRAQPLRRVGFVQVWPSQQLVGHADAPIGGVRWHLPLRLNPGCWYLHAGTWQQLLVGQWYTMDPTQVHGAVNWGPTDRLHLIADV